jgi:DNA repair ATPase RecN
MSPTPDAIEYMIGQVTGGVGREVMKAWHSSSALATGEEVVPHKIPLIGRFYGSAEGKGAEGAEYYANLRKYNILNRELRERTEDRNGVAQFKKDNPEYRIIESVKLAEREIKQLKKRKEELMEKDAPRDRIKLIDSKITAHMKRINDKVKAREERL